MNNTVGLRLFLSQLEIKGPGLRQLRTKIMIFGPQMSSRKLANTNKDSFDFGNVDMMNEMHMITRNAVCEDDWHLSWGWFCAQEMTKCLYIDVTHSASPCVGPSFGHSHFKRLLQGVIALGRQPSTRHCFDPLGFILEPDVV